jgi:hypothetical protein
MHSLLINLAFPILTLRQAQGERTGKAFSGQASFEFKNSLRTLFLSSALFFVIRVDFAGVH